MSNNYNIVDHFSHYERAYMWRLKGGEMKFVIIVMFSIVAFANENVTIQSVDYQVTELGLDGLEINSGVSDKLVASTNDNLIIDTDLYILKDERGVPYYLVGTDPNGTVMPINAGDQYDIMDMISIDSNSPLINDITFRNIQFWTIDELLTKGIVLSFHNRTMVAVLRARIFDSVTGQEYSTVGFAERVKQEPELINTVDVKAYIHFLKNVLNPGGNGSRRTLELKLSTDPADYKLTTLSETDVERLHFVIGTFGIRKILLNEEAQEKVDNIQNDRGYDSRECGILILKDPTACS